MGRMLTDRSGKPIFARFDRVGDQKGWKADTPKLNAKAPPVDDQRRSTAQGKFSGEVEGRSRFPLGRAHGAAHKSKSENHHAPRSWLRHAWGRCDIELDVAEIVTVV